MKSLNINNQIGMVSPMVVIIITLVAGVGVFFGLKNSSLMQPTPTYSPEATQRAQPDPYQQPLQHANEVITIDEENEVVQFEAQITGYNYGCYVDAPCLFETDRGTIFLSPGRTTQAYAVMGIWEEQPIGTHVEVQAVRDRENENTYLLYTPNDIGIDLYVKKLPEPSGVVTQPTVGSYGANDTFNMSTGDEAIIDGGYKISFDRLQSVSDCGSDVVRCPDDIIIKLSREGGIFIKEFTLTQFNYPYKIDTLDLSVIDQIDEETFTFKLSPTRF